MVIANITKSMFFCIRKIRSESWDIRMLYLFKSLLGKMYMYCICVLISIKNKNYVHANVKTVTVLNMYCSFYKVIVSVRTGMSQTHSNSKIDINNYLFYFKITVSLRIKFSEPHQWNFLHIPSNKAWGLYCKQTDM